MLKAQRIREGGGGEGGWARKALNAVCGLIDTEIKLLDKLRDDASRSHELLAACDSAREKDMDAQIAKQQSSRSFANLVNIGAVEPLLGDLKDIVDLHLLVLPSLRELDRQSQKALGIADLIDGMQRHVENLGYAIAWKFPEASHVSDASPAMRVAASAQFDARIKSESSKNRTKEGKANVMKAPVDFVIVTALEEERDAVLGLLPGQVKLAPTREDIRVYYGASLSGAFSDGKPVCYSAVLVPLLGMGRVDAANATNDGIRKWKPKRVLLVGIAGGIAASGARLGDVLVSDQVVDYELQRIEPDGPQIRYSVHLADRRLLGAAKNFIDAGWMQSIAAQRPSPGAPNRLVGPIASGDKVIAAKDVLARYRKDWPKLIGVEMEGGGAASACSDSADAPGFFMIRCVSDLADEQKDSPDVQRWRAYACHTAAAYAIGLLKSGPVVPVREEAATPVTGAKSSQGTEVSAPPSPPSASGPSAKPLLTWKEKLEYLLEQEALNADPARGFQLKKEIEEARAKIRELGG